MKSKAQTLNLLQSKIKRFRIPKMTIYNVSDFLTNPTSLCNERPKINLHTEDINQIFVPVVCAADKCLNPSDIRIIKIKPCMPL